MRTPGSAPRVSVGPSGLSRMCNVSLHPLQGHRRANDGAPLASALLKRFSWTESRAPASLNTG